MKKPPAKPKLKNSERYFVHMLDDDEELPAGRVRAYTEQWDQANGVPGWTPLSSIRDGEYREWFLSQALDPLVSDDPVLLLHSFTHCVDAGVYPPLPVLHRLAEAFHQWRYQGPPKLLSNGKRSRPKSLDEILGIAGKRGKASAGELGALNYRNHMLFNNMGILLQIGAKVSEAAEIVVADMELDSSLCESSVGQGMPRESGFLGPGWPIAIPEVESARTMWAKLTKIQQKFYIGNKVIARKTPLPPDYPLNNLAHFPIEAAPNFRPEERRRAKKSKKSD